MGPALFDQNEAQYAAAVREMLDRPADYLPSVRGQLERGVWYVPTNDGIPRLQKPPLVYWTLLVSMSVFGVNEFAARLPNALASLAWFAGIFLIGRRIGGVRLGRAGATILVTMAGTFIFCHLIAPEPFLAATLTWTFWCFLRASDDLEGTGPRWMLTAWVGMALGVMCKGLHGALYPLAVAAILAWRLPATRPTWKRLLRPTGLLVFTALVVPWYIAVERHYPGFLHDQFINEQLGHVFNRRYPSGQQPGALLRVFWPEHLVFFLPWTFFVPAALATRRLPTTNASNLVARELLVAWFVVTAASVTFSSMQDYYLMTAWGPVALWLARPWAAEANKPQRRLDATRAGRLSRAGRVAGVRHRGLAAGAGRSAGRRRAVLRARHPREHGQRDLARRMAPPAATDLDDGRGVWAGRRCGDLVGGARPLAVRAAGHGRGDGGGARLRRARVGRAGGSFFPQGTGF